MSNNSECSKDQCQLKWLPNSCGQQTTQALHFLTDTLERLDTENWPPITLPRLPLLSLIRPSSDWTFRFYGHKSWKVCAVSRGYKLSHNWPSCGGQPVARPLGMKRPAVNPKRRLPARPHRLPRFTGAKLLGRGIREVLIVRPLPTLGNKPSNVLGLPKVCGKHSNLKDVLFRTPGTRATCSNIGMWNHVQ